MANKYGLTRNAFIMKSIEFMMTMDPGILKQIQGWADAMEAPAGTLVSNIFIERKARLDARARVRGINNITLLQELSKNEKGLITGNELYAMLLAQFIEEEYQIRKES